MKTITIKNLIIQIDSEGKNPIQEAQEAIDLINHVLQRELGGISPQILSSGIDSSDIEVNENEEV